MEEFKKIYIYNLQKIFKLFVKSFVKNVQAKLKYKINMYAYLYNDICKN